MNNISPEEKLLRLIRGGKKKPSADAGQTFLNPRVATPRGAFLARARKGLTLQVCLLIALVLSCLYWAYAYFVDPLWIERSTSLFLSTSPAHKSPALEVGAPSKSLDDYLKDMPEKSSFKNIDRPESSYAPEDPELIKDLSLIAIISGPEPEAAIENLKDKKTYQVKAGDSIGLFQVEKITEKKVGLTHQGGHYELTL